MRMIIFFLFITNPLFAYNLDSPRNTMKTFLNSMERFKLGDQTGILDAIETFNTSRLDPLTQSTSVELAAKNLIQTLDKLEKIEFDKIPAKPNGDFWIYKRSIAQIGDEKYPVEISIGKTEENNWKFTPETLKSIGRYAQALKEEKTLKGITPLVTASSKFRDFMPEWTGETYFLLLNGQWLGILFILLIGFISGKIAKIYSARTLEKVLRKGHVTISAKNKNNVYFSLSIIFAAIIWIIGIRFLELEDSVLSILTRIGFFILSTFLVLFSYYLVELIAGYFLKIAEQTENKFDDILVPILKKIAQFIVLVTGFVIIGESFGLNMRALIAGLGIGGLAFALAAKDSISNVFGSLMVLLDKPFEVGDFLKIDGRIEGKVESVGLRSTRLRTIQESQITIPNGLLTSTTIDNFGRRLMRRFQTMIGIQYDTPPEKVEAFCEGIRELIVSNKVTYKEEFHVYLTSFADSALNIEVILFFEVPDFATECLEKNRLLLDIIKLAKKLGVEFAYPTRTIYKYDMEKPLGKKLET